VTYKQLDFNLVHECMVSSKLQIPSLSLELSGLGHCELSDSPSLQRSEDHLHPRLSPIRQPHDHQPNTGLGPSGIAKATPWAPPPCPPPKRQQGSGRAADAVLAATRAEGARRASHAVHSMAIPSAPCCQIRALVIHVYPDGIKAYGHERHTVPLGR
jgi:hypothetical protein